MVKIRYSRYPENRQEYEDNVVFDPIRKKNVHACRECGIPSQGRFHFYCSKEHKQKWEKENVPNGWGEMRLRILKRDNYKCVACGDSDYELKLKLTAALLDYQWKLQYLYCLEVDHIKPVKTHPELEYEESNLRTLCHNCHVYHGAKPQNDRPEMLPQPPLDVKSLDKFLDSKEVID